MAKVDGPRRSAAELMADVEAARAAVLGAQRGCTRNFADAPLDSPLETEWWEAVSELGRALGALTYARARLERIRDGQEIAAALTTPD